MAFAAIPAIISRLTIKDYVIAALVTALSILATLSFGFSIWGIGIEGWKPKSERLGKEVTALKNANKEAEKEWAETFEQIRQSEKEKAQEADRNAKQELEEANARAEHFIANNRVRCPAGNISYRPTGSAEGSATENSNGPSAPAELDGAFVAVPDEDVRICTENTVRLQEARNWALEISDPDRSR